MYMIEKVENLLKDNSYDANVYNNRNQLVVELIDEFSPVSVDEIVNTKPYFAIKTQSGEDAEVKINSDMISSAYSTSEQGGVLVMTFTTEGQQAISECTSGGNGTLYFCFGEKELPMSYSSVYTQSYLGLVIGSVETADYYASEILSAKYDIELTNSSNYTITSEVAKRNCIVAVLLTVVLFAVCVAILCIRFKKLGLVGSLVLLIGLLLQIILLQAVPIFVLTGPSLFASFICLIVGEIAVYSILNNMSKEYKLGKILTASVKFGYDKIWKTILSVFIVMLFPSVVTYFFGTYLVKHFAMALICGLAVYMFSTLLFTKFFTKWLTNITFKSKDYGFTREAHIDELK